VPTGCGFDPALNDSTVRNVVDGRPSAWNVPSEHGAVAAAAAGNAASAAIKTYLCLFTAPPQVSSADEHTRMSVCINKSEL
jgi:hypothetical protein